MFHQEYTCNTSTTNIHSYVNCTTPHSHIISYMQQPISNVQTPQTFRQFALDPVTDKLSALHHFMASRNEVNAGFAKSQTAV